MLKPRNCNVTWIASPETRNIKITAGEKDTPLQYEKACDSKLVITATASSGVRYSCTFCDTKGFSLTFSYPKSVTFDVVDPDKIARITWYRVWFEGKDKLEIRNKMAMVASVLTNCIYLSELMYCYKHTYDVGLNSNQT